MEKYGVDTGPDDLTKQGSGEVTCPRCGTKAEKHGNVYKCPRCGTEPFEGVKHGEKGGGE